MPLTGAPFRLVLSALVACTLVAFGRSSRAAEPTKEECASADEAAQPLRRGGKLIEARGQLAVCVAATCPAVVRDDCAHRVAEIDRALPRVAFDVTTPEGRSVASAVVTVDGTRLTDRLDGPAIPVDPGEHQVVFDAPGFLPVERTLILEEGDGTERFPVTLHAAAPHSLVVTASGTTTASGRGARTGHGEMPELTLAAWTSIGVGGAGIVTSLVFGAIAWQHRTALDAACGGATHTCPPSSTPEIQALHTSAAGANVALGLGIAGLAFGGLVLWFQPHDHGSRSATTSSLQVSPWLGLAAAGVGGTFR